MAAQSIMEHVRGKSIKEKNLEIQYGKEENREVRQK